MLEGIALVLVALWGLTMATSDGGGAGYNHVLLVAAAAVVALRVMQFWRQVRRTR